MWLRLKRWRAWELGRQNLSAWWKYWLKKVIPTRPEALTAQIPIPSPSSIERALRLWVENPHFVQAVQSVIHFDRHKTFASIIVLTHNNLPLTRLCVESLYRHTGELSFELIIVDNNSQDGTQAYLDGLQKILPNLRLVLNALNEGFARANNQGIMRARGDYIVLLNNDTIVTPKWLPRLIAHLERERKIGMAGPVTNCAGNEQMIPARYSSLEELERFAKERYEAFNGRCFEIESLAMFCVVFRRHLVDEIGLLDERFGLGTFEDDDFCYRAKLRDYKLICAEDVFVHHFGRGTTRSLGDKQYLELFESNRKKFERKWGVRWRPHRLRVPE